MRKMRAPQGHKSHASVRTQKRRRFQSDYVNFRDIMSPELAQVYQEESFELPDFATDGLHPRLLRRVKAAEQSLLAAKLRRQCAEDVSEADAEELCHLLDIKPQAEKEEKEVSTLDLEGFALLSGPLLGLPLPGLSAAVDESDSEEEPVSLEEMLKFPEAEAMFHTLPLDKEGHVSSADLGEAIAAKKGEVAQFLMERAKLVAMPMKSRSKLESLINWRIERDDALGTLFFTFVLLIMLYLVVQFDLDILSYQRSEDAVRRYIMAFGGGLPGPYLTDHVADAASFFGWLRESGLAAFFGLPTVAADGLTRFHLAGANVLLGDVMVSHISKDGEESSFWLLHSSTAQAHLSSNPSDYLGAARAALGDHARDWRDPLSKEIEVSFSMHNEVANQLMLVKLNTKFLQSGDMDMRVFASACAATAEVSVGQWIVNILFLVAIGWLALAESKDAVAAMSHGCKAFGEYWGFWNVVDWCCIALSIVTVVAWFVSLSYVSSEPLPLVHEAGFDALSLSEEQLLKMQEELEVIRGWMLAVRILATLLAITAVMKFFKGFRANPRLQIVADAIGKSLNNVAHFFLIFWTLFACFAIVAHLLFGNDIVLFSSLSSSLEASMSTLMGEFEWYVEVAGKAKNGFLSSGMPVAFVHIWFVIYICFALLVLFNMLLAMVLDSYGAAAQVLHKRADAPTIITQTWRYFKRWKETRGFIPLRQLARELLSMDCHPMKVVTLSSLQAAFPQMKSLQARYLMRTLFEEDKRQKATKQVLEGAEEVAAGASEVDPKEVAAACLPAFRATTEPMLDELLMKLRALEHKVDLSILRDVGGHVALDGMRPSQDLAEIQLITKGARQKQSQARGFCCTGDVDEEVEHVSDVQN